MTVVLHNGFIIFFVITYCAEVEDQQQNDGENGGNDKDIPQAGGLLSSLQKAHPFVFKNGDL